MDNTKLAASLRSLNEQFELDTLGSREPLLDQAAAALEAAEAELTRRDTVIARAMEEAHDFLRTQDVNYEEDNFAAGQVDAAECIRRILAAAPVSLEAVKAEAPWDRTDGCFGHCDPEGWYATCLAPCDVPPPGWWCSRGRGHDGPCAAWPVSTEGDAK